MDWVSAGSAGLAVMSLIISVVFAWRTEGLGRLSVVDSHLERIRGWADETVAVLVELSRECRESANKNGFDQRIAEQRTRLSIQVERGRWFFPNFIQDQYGLAKDPAYQGLRQPVLDAVVAAFDIADGATWTDRAEVRGDLWRAQRLFVSEVQALLNPARRYEKVDEILKDYRRTDSELRAKSIDQQREWAKGRLKHTGPSSSK